jgi:hypothetical protein
MIVNTDWCAAATCARGATTEMLRSAVCYAELVSVVPMKTCNTFFLSNGQRVSKLTARKEQPPRKCLSGAAIQPTG